MSTPRTAGVVLAWLVSVAAATAVAMVAIGAVGSGIVDRGPRALSPSEVEALLTSVPPTPVATTGGPATTGSTGSTESAGSTGSTASAVEPVTRAFTSAGGTVVAACDPGAATARIVSATPAQGFGLESIEPEDGSQRVRFRAGGGGDDDDGGGGRVEVYVRCEGGQPVDNS